jgi:hypothetical protein
VDRPGRPQLTRRLPPMPPVVLTLTHALGTRCGLTPYAWSRVQTLPASRHHGHAPVRCALTTYLSTAVQLNAPAERSRRHRAVSREEQLRTSLRLPLTAPHRCSSPAASLAAPRLLPGSSKDGSQLAALARHAAATREAAARCNAPKPRAPPRCSVCHFTPPHPSSWAYRLRPPRRRGNSCPAAAWRPLRLACRRSDRRPSSLRHHSLARRLASRICPCSR